MENCLLTKLKGTVDNSNLKKMGVIKMRIVVGANALISRMAESAPLGAEMKIKALGDGYFTTTRGGSTSAGKELRFGQDVYPVQGEYDIEVSYKYNASMLVMLNVTIKDIDFSDFDYTPLKALTYFDDTADVDYNKLPSDAFDRMVTVYFEGTRKGKLNIDNFANNAVLASYLFNSAPNGQITGNIASLGNKPSLTTIQCKVTRVTGDIASLGSDTALTRIEQYMSTGITGSIEGLAAAQVANGRTSGTLAVFYSRPITFNGESPVDAATKTIKFGTSMENPTAEETTQGYQIV